ncbi:MAG TPA: DNA replication complex GINS family protein [Methanotrichaceae archaeon]|nr:DNA replication complex GINS family protein [Methanotrichaceae archaeon]
MSDLDLVNLLRKERKAAELLPMEPSFYQKVGVYLAELERDHSEVKDPYSVEAQIVEDELKAARGSIGRLIDLRIKKITRKVQRAGSASRDVAIKGMTPEEERIYRQTLAALTEGRESILAQVNQVKRQTTERAITPKRGMTQEYALVILMESVPTFVGVDGRRYSLMRGDLVMLPALHAKNLCNKNLARELKQV